MVVKLACCISNYTLETKVQCNEVIALFVLILASPLNNFYYLAQASNSYWLDIFVPMSSFSHSPSRENMIQTEEKRLCLVVF